MKDVIKTLAVIFFIAFLLSGALHLLDRARALWGVLWQTFLILSFGFSGILAAKWLRDSKEAGK
ncbi:MAG: hypothetical protein WCS71_06255 [Sphaerochaetaceae bacterium]|jgi:hypothetical protein